MVEKYRPSWRQIATRTGLALIILGSSCKPTEATPISTPETNPTIIACGPPSKFSDPRDTSKEITNPEWQIWPQNHSVHLSTDEGKLYGFSLKENEIFAYISRSRNPNELQPVGSFDIFEKRLMEINMVVNKPGEPEGSDGVLFFWRCGGTVLLTIVGPPTTHNFNFPKPTNPTY